MHASLPTVLLRNSHLLTLSIALILIAGLAAWSSLPRIEDPRITRATGRCQQAQPRRQAWRRGLLADRRRRLEGRE
jgi:hypothetical protein